MKKYILILIILGVTCFNTFAQDEEDQPVSNPFESGILIDQQTSVIPDVKTLEFIIQHKFGAMDKGISDLWGIYSPGANVRLALNYVPINNLQIGAGITKKNMYTDLNAKYTIWEQTENNTKPVAVSVFGSLAIDGRNESAFGTGKVYRSGEGIAQYTVRTSGRLSYFSQIMVGRKFNDWLSLQAAASFTHHNMVAKTYNHDVIGAHLCGRIKFSTQGSFIFNYDHPLKIQGISEQLNWDTHAKPNVSAGIEIFTYTHAFQLFVGTADGIIPQDIMVYNQKDWKDKGLAIGFTITRLWMF